MADAGPTRQARHLPRRLSHTGRARRRAVDSEWPAQGHNLRRAYCARADSDSGNYGTEGSERYSKSFNHPDAAASGLLLPVDGSPYGSPAGLARYSFCAGRTANPATRIVRATAYFSDRRTTYTAASVIDGCRYHRSYRAGDNDVARYLRSM